MISAGGWSGDLTIEPREEFAEIITAALYGETEPPPAVPEEPGARAPRPNAAQGTSDGTVVAPSPGQLFTEWLTGVPYTDPNHVPGNRRSMTAAEAGQHAGWQASP